MPKKKKEVIEEKPHGEDNQPQGDREQDHIPTDDSILGLEKRILMIEDKSGETMSLVRDCIDVLKNYKVWLNDVDDQLKKIKSRLGL